MDVTTLERKKSLTRRDFLKLAGIAAVGLPLYAGEISRHEISVQRLMVKLPRLPEAFRGLTIAQLSDFHYAQFTEPYFIRQVIERVKRSPRHRKSRRAAYLFSHSGRFLRADPRRFPNRCEACPWMSRPTRP